MPGVIDIVLRDDLGRPIELPTQPMFAEVQDQDGQVALVLCRTKEGGLKVITHQSAEAATYERLFKVKLAPVKNLPF